jgi:hypothetical protein
MNTDRSAGRRVGGCTAAPAQACTCIVGRLLGDDQARTRRNEHRGWNGYRDGAVHQPIHDGRRRGRGRGRVLVASWPHHGDSRLASRVAWSDVSVPRGACIALESRPNTMGFVNKARRRCAPAWGRGSWIAYPATVIGRAPPQASKSKHPKHCQAGPDKQSQAWKAEQEAFHRLMSRASALSRVEWEKHVGRLIGGVELG